MGLIILFLGSNIPPSSEYSLSSSSSSVQSSTIPPLNICFVVASIGVNCGSALSTAKFVAFKNDGIKKSTNPINNLIIGDGHFLRPFLRQIANVESKPMPKQIIGQFSLNRRGGKCCRIELTENLNKNIRIELGKCSSEGRGRKLGNSDYFLFSFQSDYLSIHCFGQNMAQNIHFYKFKMQNK